MEPLIIDDEYGDWPKHRHWDIEFNSKEDIVEQFIRIISPNSVEQSDVRDAVLRWAEFHPSARNAPDELVDAMLQDGLLDFDPRS